MPFDVRTLLVAVAVASAVCAVARLLLWRMHPAMPGLRHWMLAAFAGVAALLTYAGHGRMPGALSLGMAQLLVATGFVLTWDGFRRFFGRPPLSGQALGVVVAVGGGSIVLSAAAGSMVAHTAINTLMIAGLSGLIARELLREARPGRLAVRVTAGIYGANALFFIVRGAFRLDAPPDGVPAASDPFYAVSLLWWLAAAVGVTLGMVLMAGERLQEELHHRANRDPLTGALNRRAFALLAEQQMAQTTRTGRPLSVLMMDLDHFKRINDERGHASGDATLKHFVAVAGGALRAEDVLCRFGGEEFVALLPDAAGPQALAAAERLRLHFEHDGGDTVSIGVAQVRPGETLESLLKRADGALYDAKRLGRNRSEVAAPEPEPEPEPDGDGEGEREGPGPGPALRPS